MVWDSTGRRWPTVLSIPYGSARDQLGFKRYPGQEPIIPSALAVTPEGFAILDPQKHRVVLFSSRGKVLREWRGLRQQASAMVWDGAEEHLVVIDHEPTGRLVALQPEGGLARSRENRPVFSLVASGVGVWAVPQVPAGNVDRTARVSDRLTVAEDEEPVGLEGGRQLSFGTASQDETSTTLTVVDRWRHTFVAKGSHGPAGPVMSFVRSPSFTRELATFSLLAGSYDPIPVATNPLFFLAVRLSDGSVEDYEQVATCSLHDLANQYTFFTASPDGEIYQLCVGERGVEVRRRPSAVS